MSTIESTALFEDMRTRRDAIAADWYHVLIHICAPSLQPYDLYQSLVQLTEQILTIVCSDVFDCATAQSIGMQLTALGYDQPEALARTQTLLIQALPAVLPLEMRPQVQQHLATLIGEVAAGFCRKIGESVLTDQERLQREIFAHQRQVEATLRSTEETTQAILNAIPDVMFRISRAGIYLDFKTKQGQRTEVPGEFVGKHIDEVLPADVAALTKHYIEQALQTHTIQIFEYQLRRGDRLHDYEARIVYIRADEVLVVVRDITQRKQAELALRVSQERLNTVVTNVPIILFSYDCSGIFTLAAGKGLEKLGLTSNQVVGCSVFDTYRNVPGVLENMRRALAGETFTVLERMHKAVFETTYIPCLDADGSVLSVIGVASDITERARVEAELASAHRRLAERQEGERLHLARELHDSAVQQLLSVKYQLEALKRGVSQIKTDERHSAAFHQLLAAVQREVLSVVSQLRGMIGELRPAGLEELGLIAALEGYIANLQHQHKTSMPKIELDVDRRGGSLPQPIALCLFRVIQETYRNTLKHATARLINTRLRVHEDAVVLTIRDDGCGFNVPTRLSELTRSNHFGLAGMSERVALAHGQLTIRSQRGIGTEVIVRIPLQHTEGMDG